MCVYHPRAKEVIDPILIEYPDVFVPLLCNSDNYKMGTSVFFDVMRKDNEVGNLAMLNRYFCEITGVYWLYKQLSNFHDPDMVGLCHYRRVLDLNYRNLDPSKIYAKRVSYALPNHLEYVPYNPSFSFRPIIELILDVFFNTFPEYSSVREVCKEDLKFYDKNMFIMNRDEFVKYFNFIDSCCKVLMNTDVWTNIKSWYDQGKAYYTREYLFGRQPAYFLEYFTGLYLAKRKIEGCAVESVPMTSSSFCEKI